MSHPSSSERPRLLIYDVGFGPRPSWYLPRLCPDFEVHVLWTASGDSRRDQARTSAFDTWCANTALTGRAGAAEQLLAFARNWQPDGLTSFGELAVIDVHLVAGQLGLPANQARSLPALRNKYLQRQLLHQAGVAVPAFAPVDTFEQLRVALASVGVPAVLKPVTGAGSMATFRVDSTDRPDELWQQASAAYAADSRAEPGLGFILEELMIGQRLYADARYGCQVSVESLAGGGQVRHLAVTDKLALVEPFREACDIMPSSLPQAITDQLHQTSEAAITALGITDSAVHTELMLTEQGPRIIEVNSRIGGGVAELLHYSYGFDAVAAVAAVAVGRPVSGPAQAHRYAAFLTPQAPMPARPLRRVPSQQELLDLPAVVEAGVNYTVGDRPAPEDGTRGGTLARMVAVAGHPGELVQLSEQLSGDRFFSYEPDRG